MRSPTAAAFAALSFSTTGNAAVWGNGSPDIVTVTSLVKDMLETQKLEMQREFDRKLATALEDAYATWRLSTLKTGGSDVHLLAGPPPPTPPPPLPNCPGLNTTIGYHIVDKVWQSVQLPAGKQIADCCTECNLLGCVALEFIAENTTCNLYNEEPSKFASAPGALTAFTGQPPIPAAHDKVPIGAVFAWWRPSAAVPLPAGCEACDGTSVTTNFSPYYGLPKPDLRGRFVQGASDPSMIGNVGGSTMTAETGDHMHAVGNGVDKANRISQTYRDSGMRAPGASTTCVSGVSPTGSGKCDSHNNFHCATAADCGESVYDPPANTGNNGAHTHTVDPPYVGLLMLMRVV